MSRLQIKLKEDLLKETSMEIKSATVWLGDQLFIYQVGESGITQIEATTKGLFVFRDEKLSSHAINCQFILNY